MNAPHIRPSYPVEAKPILAKVFLDHGDPRQWSDLVETAFQVRMAPIAQAESDRAAETGKGIPATEWKPKPSETEHAAQRLFEAIRKNPGSTARALAQSAGVSDVRINQLARQLESEGKIQRTRTRRKAPFHFWPLTGKTRRDGVSPSGALVIEAVAAGFQTVVEISARSGVSEKCTRNLLGKLTARGLLTRTRGAGNTPYVYSIAEEAAQ